MVAPERSFTNSFLVVAGLTVLLFLAGIVLLPGLGTYSDEVQAQAAPVESQTPALNHSGWTSGSPSTGELLPAVSGGMGSSKECVVHKTSLRRIFGL